MGELTSNKSTKLLESGSQSTFTPRQREASGKPGNERQKKNCFSMLMQLYKYDFKCRTVRKSSYGSHNICNKVTLHIYCKV